MTPRTKMIIVTTVAVAALIIVVIGLASLAPKSKPQSVNKLPVPDFSYDADNLTVVFDASASSDPDGSISNYSWTFGDEANASGVSVTHLYPANGTYEVTLTVTDNGGGKNSTKRDVTVKKEWPPQEKKKPLAVIEVVRIDNWTVTFSGTSSKATDGARITSYEWDFGDTMTASGATLSHTYAANGTYTVALKVTDDQGESDTNTTHVTVVLTNPPAPTMPVAVIDVLGNEDGTVSLSGARSSASPGGTLLFYNWTFGDGETGSGMQTIHTYKANGSYTLTLTVTDSLGHSNSTTVTVKVTLSEEPPIPNENGPPGLLHAIEIHQDKVKDKPQLQNSLDHLLTNLDRWLDNHSSPSPM